MEILLQADIDTEHVYQVGDVYPSTGFPAGIVIKVTDGGKHGTIAALSGFSRTWGTKEITGATNEEDGRENHSGRGGVRSRAGESFSRFCCLPGIG